MGKREHYFYNAPIHAEQEEARIKKLLKKYREEPATEELKKKIWNDLQKEKHLGNIKVPFKVVFRNDAEEKYPPCIEIILDTKL